MTSDHVCFLCRINYGEGRLYFSEKTILAETVCKPCAEKLGGSVDSDERPTTHE